MRRKYNQSARTGIYEEIRQRIELLSYLPGSELPVTEMTQELGVSRSPVRDALLRLERDRLIEIFPQKGTWVARLDVENIMQERMLRAAVEEKVFTTALDALFRDRDRLIRFMSRLNGNLIQQGACIDVGDIVTFMHLDEEFHEMFYLECGCKRMYTIVQSHTGNERRVRVLNDMHLDAAQTVFVEHKTIASALEHGNAVQAMKALHDHLARLGFEIDHLVERYPDYFTKESKRA